MDLVTEMSDHFKLLGDKTRLIMMALLQGREWCVCEFVELFNISQPAVSQHIRKLKAAQLVKEQRRGQWVYYSLNTSDKPHIEAILSSVPKKEEILKGLKKQEPVAVCYSDSTDCCL
ncbi:MULTISPECIES: ArsR/SmtB family transcription factor [Paenibacillus]|uniref:HTH-type transcriptional repressor AseR n=1 Tax=Paenibacillus bovis TaxID=1616788 RepID=A0A1X9T4D6_9BACL|nr:MULTISPECIES: metalloregulator ArsR/SmtB family transcription factor [Paenibacillus]ARR10793.1 HTH-type transcriptional repressor AseR [Paenibacillus bovis]